ncbi:MAG: pyrroline-5-carboxylate reductase [Paracoccaceae bacterium]
MSRSVLLIGCGNMGYAMLKGWLGAEPDLDAHIVEPNESLRSRASDLGALAVASAQDLPSNLEPELVFLAVKPQAMAQVVPDYVRYAGGPASFVSVAAGTTIGTLAALLPGPTPIIRCMPNTPAAIGAGMLVCCANNHTRTEARAHTTELLESSGEVAWIEDEALMDAITAVSGSGPAYVFHVIECLADAGVSVGLPAELALKMARQTVMGAGKLAAETDTAPGTLREQVTSPGGTTAAGLSVLMGQDALNHLLRRTVEAARDRGQELSKT